MSVEAAAEELGVTIEEVPEDDAHLRAGGSKAPASGERLNASWLILTGCGRPPVRVRANSCIAFYKSPHRAEIVVVLSSGTEIRIPLASGDNGKQVLEFLEREVTHD